MSRATSILLSMPTLSLLININLILTKWSNGNMLSSSPLIFTLNIAVPSAWILIYSYPKLLNVDMSSAGFAYFNISIIVCIYIYIYILYIIEIIKDPNEAISKCPLCYSPIKESDLKSCHLNVEEVPKSENLVILDKICKIRNSVILINQNLKEGTRSQEMQKFSEYSPKEYNFSRITLVYSISDLLQRENAALEQGKWLAESSQELEKVPFFEQAIIYNQNRELKYDSQSQITELSNIYIYKNAR